MYITSVILGVAVSYTFDATDLVRQILNTTSQTETVFDIKPAHWPAVGRVFRQVAVEADVWEPSEFRFFVDPTEYASDLKILRRRLVSAKEWPPSADTERLPPLFWLAQARDGQAAYIKALETELAWEPSRRVQIEAAIDKANEVLQVYNHAADARNPLRNNFSRRCSLSALRALLGVEKYEAMDLP